MFWREREMENKELNGGPPCGQIRVLVVGDSGHWKKEWDGVLRLEINGEKVEFLELTCFLLNAELQIEILVFLAGVGKTSLVHLIVKGSSTAHPHQTIGCTVGVKFIHQVATKISTQHTTYGCPGSSSSSLKGDAERVFFIELWDVSGHERYKGCRSLFYSQLNGVIFVHDLSQRRTKTSLQKWAAEIAASGTFSAPLGSGGPGGLPVPYIVIGNKADIASKEGTRSSSGNLVDAARHWVEKQGLLPSSEELPLTESFPSSGSLIAKFMRKLGCFIVIDLFLSRTVVATVLNSGDDALILLNQRWQQRHYRQNFAFKILGKTEPFVAARDARYDKEGVMKFFHMLSICCGLAVVRLTSCLFQLIRRRYFSDDLPTPNTWSASPFQRTSQRLDENSSDDEQLYKGTSLSGDPYKYNILPPLPAQRNLTPPPTLYPQQPVSVTENYSLPRFSFTGSQEISGSSRSKRADISV
ncbi:hypothetical protein GOBAR_AA00409 [Gossypium barbadense]|uniref:Uncharacterized protein n=1 Tax=Gossypium barbadense TaxID=3634 RepID=A0A2P5YX75_GOSBA|nr:hypothetical protein GOBAR_AA00409 [Gossypium barbadense]